jgi:hypothetical protein
MDVARVAVVTARHPMDAEFTPVIAPAQCRLAGSVGVDRLGRLSPVSRAPVDYPLRVTTRPLTPMKQW